MASQQFPSPKGEKQQALFNGIYGPVIKTGVLCKRAVVKRKILSAESYKHRLFELTQAHLAYFEGSLQSKGRLKRPILVKEMKVVMKVDDKRLDEKDNVFQIVYSEKNDFCTLYVQASSNEERQAWIDAIRSAALKAGASFFSRYHPGVWTKTRPFYNCCHQRDRNAIGCKGCEPREKVPDVPRLPEVEACSTNKEYIAIYDYEPSSEGELELIRGEKYFVIDDSGEHWWRAENVDGNKGLIPSNYVKKNCGLESFEWYYKDLTRERSRTLLMRTGIEGCFLVRDSVSNPGNYTLQVYTMENGGSVKLYKICQNDAGQYYVSITYPQNSIEELIYYHQHNPGGLCTRLREPPPRGCKPSTAGFGHSKWELDPKRLIYSEELGSGQFAVVYKGEYTNGRNPVPVAIKKIKVKPSSDEVFQEFKILTQLGHTNLVQLYGVILNETQPKIITELLCNGALNVYLQRNEHKLFNDQNTLLDIAIQICSGMEYLEKKGIIHRDLAARNCLVGKDGVVKVGDFGLARIVLDDVYQTSEKAVFAIKWASPEVISFRKFSSKSDIWAYGILLWEIYSFGETPYSGMSDLDLVKFIKQRDGRLSKPRAAPITVYDIMKQCWASDPQTRPTFAALRSKLETYIAKGDYMNTEIS